MGSVRPTPTTQPRMSGCPRPCLVTLSHCCHTLKSFFSFICQEWVLPSALSSPSPIPVNGLALPTLPSLCRSFGIGNGRDTTTMEPFLFPQTRSGTVHQSLRGLSTLPSRVSIFVSVSVFAFLTAPPLSGCYTSFLGAQPPSCGQKI